MASTTRRAFLKRTFAASAIAAAASGGLLRPGRVVADDWPGDAFAAETPEDSLLALFDTTDYAPSDAIRVRAPRRVQNGARIPVAVSTSLPDVDSISILVEKNPPPLVSRVRFIGAEPFFSADIRMNSTSRMWCIVRSEGRLYVKKRLIQVTTGGFAG
ncbi:MAG: thiosulfate oxidation carrier protein SoxY [Acidiferrobacterales bacterium]